MKRERLKQLRESLNKKGLIDEETLASIDTELQRFLEDELEKNIASIQKLLTEKKHLGNEGNPA